MPAARDEELKAIRAAAQAIEGLEPKAQARALDYLVHRYHEPIAPAAERTASALEDLAKTVPLVAQGALRVAHMLGQTAEAAKQRAPENAS